MRSPLVVSELRLIPPKSPKNKRAGEIVLQKQLSKAIISGDYKGPSFAPSSDARPQESVDDVQGQLKWIAGWRILE
jgi:hypothetical protein